MTRLLPPLPLLPTTACISVVSNFVKYLNEGVVEKYLGAVPSGTPKE
jgi:hypothetical protein